MSERMSENEFLEHFKSGLNIPVWIKIPAEDLTIVSIYEALQEKYERAFLVDSTDPEEKLRARRYSFIGFDAYLHIEIRGENIYIQQEGEVSKLNPTDPFKTLREIINKNKAIDVFEAGCPTIIGGVAGYLSYDSIRLTENIPDRHSDLNNFPDVMFNCFSTSISYDNQENTLYVSVRVRPEGDPKRLYKSAIDQIQELIAEMKTKPTKISKELPSYDVQAEPDDKTFMDMVNKAKHYIREGDIFQVVLSRKFTLKTEADSFDIFKAIRSSSPSPYLFYIKEPNYQLIGSSPERQVSINNRIVKTNPLAGTSRRPAPENLKVVEEALLNDPKEIAEHMMLVDLGRNDIGSIAEIGTVKVTNLKSILRLSHVVHISSEVEGKLLPELDGLDALRATLPAGTLSGAPKIRAMEIIDELETSRRGVYGGAICYQYNDGTFESCIAIRMILMKNHIATVRAGAGIVYDSNARKEADETRSKAKAALSAIQIAEKGLI